MDENKPTELVVVGTVVRLVAQPEGIRDIIQLPKLKGCLGLVTRTHGGNLATISPMKSTVLLLNGEVDKGWCVWVYGPEKYEYIGQMSTLGLKEDDFIYE